MEKENSENSEKMPPNIDEIKLPEVSEFNEDDEGKVGIFENFEAKFKVIFFRS